MSLEDVYAGLSGYPKFTSFMKRRTLLEFVLIRAALEGRNITLRKLGVDAGIYREESGTPDEFQLEINELLMAILYNGIIYWSHPYRHTAIPRSGNDLSLAIRCEPVFVNKWVSKMGVSDIYDFRQVPPVIRDGMMREIGEKISWMKGLLK